MPSSLKLAEDGAGLFVLRVDVERDPLTAVPARHEAVLALPLVRLQVRPPRRELAVGEPALEGEVHGRDGLLSEEVTDPAK